MRTKTESQEWSRLRGKKHRCKRLYISILLWFLGRAVQAASKHDPAIQRETASLPDQFSFSLTVMPAGPAMTLKKENGNLQYLRRGLPDGQHTLRMCVKSVNLAYRIFTFRESNAEAAARDRIIAEGPVSYVCPVVRILDRIEIILFPRFLAVRAVKRYIKPKRSGLMRLIVCSRAAVKP